MIFFVDEDVGQITPYADILGINGYSTRIIRDAYNAWEELHNRKDDVELVFIDVMLAGGSEIDRRRYTREETEDYQITGLSLLKDLTQQNPHVFPRRAVLLSQTSRASILAKIKTVCSETQVEFWGKSGFEDIHEFATKTKEHLQRLEHQQGC